MENINYFLAIAKMLEEMKQYEDCQYDAIHNWLCEQQHDNELMTSILKDGKSIRGSMLYCEKKAREVAAKGASSVMVDDNTVFSWVRDYFLMEEAQKTDSTKEKVLNNAKKKPEEETEPKKKAKVTSEEPGVLEGQLSFDLFGDL